MGGLAEHAISEAMRASSSATPERAGRSSQDDKLDDVEVEIERRAMQLIALRQPMADDLRDAVAAMKVANNLERVGDFAKNIAKRALVEIAGRSSR